MEDSIEQLQFNEDFDERWKGIVKTLKRQRKYNDERRSAGYISAKESSINEMFFDKIQEYYEWSKDYVSTLEMDVLNLSVKITPMEYRIAKLMVWCHCVMYRCMNSDLLSALDEMNISDVMNQDKPQEYYKMMRQLYRWLDNKQNINFKIT